MTSFSVYQKAMKSEWPGWWVTWPLSMSLNVGNVIGTEGHVLRLAGLAEGKGLTCVVSEVGSSELFKYDSNGTASVRFKAAGVGAPGFEALVAADAGALIEFAHNTALLVVFRNLVTLSISDVRDLATQLVKQYWDGRWSDDLAVVTDVVSVARGAVFAAAASGSTVELRATANVGSMTLADLAGGAAVVFSKNLGMEWTGTQFTPFFRVVRLRQSWIGSVKADYGPRQRGSFALPPAPVPNDLMEQALDNPSNTLEWLSADFPIMFDENLPAITIHRRTGQMGTYDEYLALLSEQGLNESDVEPIIRRQYWSSEASAKLDEYRNSLEDPFDAVDTLKHSLSSPFGLLDAIMSISRNYDRAKATEEIQSGNANSLLKDLAGDLRIHCSRNRMPRIETPVFHGVYPTRLFNAVTVPRSSGHLVLMESATLEIVEVVTSLIMAQDEVNDDRMRDIQMICQGYWNHISAKLRDRYLPQHVEIYDLQLNISRDEFADSVELTTATEQFVIAHEWGHISLGHAVAGGPCALGPTQTNAIPDSKIAWEEEFSADLWAARALLGPARDVWSSERDDVDLLLAGIHLFLGLARIIESFASHDGYEATTHPPTSERIWMIDQLGARAHGSDPCGSRCMLVDDALNGVHLRAFGPIPNILEERRKQLTRLYNGIVRTVFAYEKELLIR